MSVDQSVGRSQAFRQGRLSGLLGSPGFGNLEAGGPTHVVTPSRVPFMIFMILDGFRSLLLTAVVRPEGKDAMLCCRARWKEGIMGGFVRLSLSVVTGPREKTQ